MSNISFNDALLLINQGGWMLSGGHVLKEALCITKVTKVALEETRFLIECDTANIQAEVDPTFATVIGGNNPREIQIFGPVIVQRQKKKVDGGGWYAAIERGMIFKFVHEANQKVRQLGQENRARRSNIVATARRRSQVIGLLDRHYEVPVKGLPGKIAKCFILHCKEGFGYPVDEINMALYDVYEEGSCPIILTVPHTSCHDQACVVCSSSRVTASQAQKLWDSYVDLLDAQSNQD